MLKVSSPAVLTLRVGAAFFDTTSLALLHYLATVSATMDERRRAYLFENHSLETISGWYERLKFFRYFRAYGGHANDGDSLDLAIRYEGESELIGIFVMLGIEPVRYESEPEQPLPGQSYPGAEFARFPQLVPGTRWIRQPGRLSIVGAEAHVWCYRDHVLVSAGPASYLVSEETVRAAESIEATVDFTRIMDRILDPPGPTDHYISPANHPSWF